jgi:hypothetical protein
LAYVDEFEQETKETGVLFYINVFNKGYIFSKRDIDQFLRQLQIKPESFFYEPCSNTEIIKRVIRNLISSYEKAGANEKVEELIKLLEVFAL